MIFPHLLQNRKGMYYSHFIGEETKSQNILCIFTQLLKRSGNMNSHASEFELAP